MCHPKLQEMGHHLRPATRQARSGGYSECSIHPSQLYAGPYSSLKVHHFPLLSLLGGAALWSLFLEHIKYTYISNYYIIIKEAESLERSRSQRANHNRAEAATQCSTEHARLCGRLQILIIAVREWVWGEMLRDKPKECYVGAGVSEFCRVWEAQISSTSNKRVAN